MQTAGRSMVECRQITGNRGRCFRKKANVSGAHTARLFANPMSRHAPHTCTNMGVYCTRTARPIRSLSVADPPPRDLQEGFFSVHPGEIASCVHARKLHGRTLIARVCSRPFVIYSGLSVRRDARATVALCDAGLPKATLDRTSTPTNVVDPFSAFGRSTYCSAKVIIASPE